MIDKIEIDSFKIRIQFDLCEIIDDSILGKWILVNQLTGIIDEAEFKKNSMKFNDSGIKTKFAIEKQMTSKQIVEEFFIILINSKVLKKKYFQGINKFNIKFVYRYLISLKVISFSLQTFLDSEITDVDFKRDRIQLNFRNSIHELYSLARESKSLDTGCKKFLKKNNEGIQFSDRKTTNITTNPFLKIYNKEIELKRGFKDSKLFFSTFLFEKENIENIIKDRIRVEFTIKNKKHFRNFGIENTSLGNILKIPQKFKKEMLIEILNKHLNLEIKLPEIRNIKEINNLDMILTNFLFLAIQENESIPILIENIIKKINSRQRKSYWRNRLFKIYNERLLDEDKLKKITKNSMDFLKWLIS